MPELYHKENKVLSYKVGSDGAVVSVKVVEPQLLPLKLSQNCDPQTFTAWLKSRTVPASRDHLEVITRIHGTDWMVPKNYLSLTDQYWVKKMDETWKDVNFFTHYYSTDVGDAAFSPWLVKKKTLNSNSPDVTTGGMLRKRWRQLPDKTSILLKDGNKLTHQEPLSEVLVSVLLEQLQIASFVRYDLEMEGMTLCSRCNNMITAKTELVSMADIYHLVPKDECEGTADHILKVCETFGIPGMQPQLDAMIFIDSITGNTDRNLGNIGLLRDADTLEWIGPAPLFDFGAAYWSKGPIDNKCSSKLFRAVEPRIFRKMRKEVDVETILNGDQFSHCIETYPCFGRDRKQKLIAAIRDRNKNLLSDRKKIIEIDL